MTWQWLYSKHQSEVIMELKTEIQDLKTSFDRNIRDLKIEIYDMKNTILSLNISDQTRESRPRSECPSCMEILRQPMRLMQCGQGHIVCDQCYTRLEGRENLCPTCRGDITGRPTELERVLGLVWSRNINVIQRYLSQCVLVETVMAYWGLWAIIIWSYGVRMRY